MALSTFAFGGGANADNTVTYSLSGATFNTFTDNGNLAETLSGTWTVDNTTGTVTAMSLTATGSETIYFSCHSVCLGAQDSNTFQLQGVNQAGYPLYLVYQFSPASVLFGATCCNTNLYDLEGGYSGLTSPGVLTATTGIAFAGTPGQSNCQGKSVSALAQQYNGLSAAASALGYQDVQALQTGILTYCGK
jgi:hypothetical protein